MTGQKICQKMVIKIYLLNNNSTIFKGVYMKDLMLDNVDIVPEAKRWRRRRHSNGSLGTFTDLLRVIGGFIRRIFTSIAGLIILFILILFLPFIMLKNRMKKRSSIFIKNEEDYTRSPISSSDEESNKPISIISKK